MTAEWPRRDAIFTLTLDVRDTRYPHDPGKDVEQSRIKFELGAELVADLNVSLEGQWTAKRYPNDSLKDLTTMALDFTATFEF